IRQDWMSIKSIMSNYVGIVRTEERLSRAVSDLSYLSHRIEKFYRNVFMGKDKIELRNGVQTALIIAEAAKKNKLSRGCHYRK
ncbi:MAG: L-aspartate oxidase, partial [Minisyncoccia bacterium]